MKIKKDMKDCLIEKINTQIRNLKNLINIDIENHTTLQRIDKILGHVRQSILSIPLTRLQP